MNTIAAMAFVMITELTVDPNKIDEFIESANAHLPASLNYEGNIQFKIMVDTAEPNKVLFYEVWESQAAQQQYWAWRVQQGDFETLKQFLIAEPKPKFYNMLF